MVLKNNIQPFPDDILPFQTDGPLQNESKRPVLFLPSLHQGCRESGWCPGRQKRVCQDAHNEINLKGGRKNRRKGKGQSRRKIEDEKVPQKKTLLQLYAITAPFVESQRACQVSGAGPCHSEKRSEWQVYCQCCVDFLHPYEFLEIFNQMWAKFMIARLHVHITCKCQALIAARLSSPCQPVERLPQGHDNDQHNQHRMAVHRTH